MSWFVRCVLHQVLRTNTWAQQEDNTWAQSRSYLRYLAWEHWPESASEAKLNQGVVFNYMQHCDRAKWRCRKEPSTHSQDDRDDAKQQARNFFKRAT